MAGKVHGNKKYNRYDLSGDYGIGYTRKSQEFYFDLEDYELIKNHCWYIETGGRVCARNPNGKTPFKMHRVIMAFYGNVEEIDHENHNQSDNRKLNLRPCTHMENLHNTKVPKSNTSGVIGISFRKDTKKYSVKIEYNKKIMRLGCFSNLEDAIIVRLKAEKEYFGEFASQKYLFEKYKIE
jgi:hypothetical protein